MRFQEGGRTMSDDKLAALTALLGAAAAVLAVVLVLRWFA
jgi:hypothetical protein